MCNKKKGSCYTTLTKTMNSLKERLAKIWKGNILKIEFLYFILWN